MYIDLFRPARERLQSCDPGRLRDDARGALEGNVSLGLRAIDTGVFGHQERC